MLPLPVGRSQRAAGPASRSVRQEWAHSDPGRGQRRRSWVALHPAGSSRAAWRAPGQPYRAQKGHAMATDRRTRRLVCPAHDHRGRRSAHGRCHQWEENPDWPADPELQRRCQTGCRGKWLWRCPRRPLVRAASTLRQKPMAEQGPRWRSCAQWRLVQIGSVRPVQRSAIARCGLSVAARALARCL